MNKQQLALKIWESANKMRSKIEASEYKDFILGFIFYKFLSDKEVKFLKDEGLSDEDINQLNEEDEEAVEYIKKNLGYFISYNDLFSTWIKMGKDFDVSNVRDALSAFNRLINSNHKKVFEGIFNTLQTGLSKLGDNSSSQTKAISDLIQLIKDIPMDGKQDYDVLGFIYEYLISMFAANAGKKAGEFYTPHEVSVLMSEIIAYHVRDRKNVKIYDPTSGSGSLLINIGKSVGKYMCDENNIKYYAQELKQNTYNLTRMNLVMRGVLPDNIVTRNGDTLEEDWPYFDESNPIKTYDALYVDAVVSNPPYSQRWDPSNKENDPRYSRFGLAPKTKADYAFLLHDLYHIKSDGIMTIVLPHGVLFRGGEEGEIRKNLIENNNIDTIIGLPENIFFGTGIPTIIMVLKKKRDINDVLIIDASKEFIKEGKNNKLQASNIKKIVDTVISRETIEKYSRKVSQKEIRENEYNLNIPRYVDSSESAETWDIYASMFGGIPIKEIDELNEYWEALPTLKKELFIDNGTPYTNLSTQDIKSAIINNSDVKSFLENYKCAFNNFNLYLKNELIEEMESVNINNKLSILSEDIFKRLNDTPLIDKYKVYQLLDNEWNDIAIDLEIIQTEGFEATKIVDPNFIIKKKDGKEQEVQEGWKGHIIPFDLVEKNLLKSKKDALSAKETRLAEIVSEYEEILDSLSEEEKASDITKESNAAFDSTGVNKELKEIYADIQTEEIIGLNKYIALLDVKAKKQEKEEFIKSHTEVNWSQMEPNKDGTYSKKTVNAYLIKLQSEYVFTKDSYEEKIAKVSKLILEEKELKALVKVGAAELHLLTKKTIENLSDDQVRKLLEDKWIKPLTFNINKLPEYVINSLVTKIKLLSNKYQTTYFEVENQIKETENILSNLINELEGSEFDMKGLSEFKTLLDGK